MADDYVQVAPDSTGKKIDNTTETTGAGTVERQRVSVAAVGSNNQLGIDANGNIGVSAGTISANTITAGTVSVSAATVNAGTLAAVSATTITSIPSITVVAMNAGTVTASTITSLPAIPAGSNVIGGIKLYDPNGNTAAVVTASSALKVDASATTQPVTFSAGTIGSATITAGTVGAATVTAGTVSANQGTGSSANPWTVQGLQPAATTIAISTSASSGSVSVSNMNIVTALVTANTALAGMTALFEGTVDGSNWVQLQGGRTDTSVIENGPTSIASANTPRAWDIPVGGLTTMRWRTTALGAGAATVSLAPQTLPYDPVPSVGLSNFGGTTVAAVAKGTQATNALGVQDFKDSGRTPITFIADRVTGVTSETLLTVTINKNGTTTSASTYLATSGKTLRIQGVYWTVRATSTTLVSGRGRIRYAATSAAPTTATVALVSMEAGSVSAVAESIGVDDTEIPDGIEIAGNTAIGFSHLDSSTLSTVSMTVIAFEY